MSTSEWISRNVKEKVTFKSTLKLIQASLQALTTFEAMKKKENNNNTWKEIKNKDGGEDQKCA